MEILSDSIELVGSCDEVNTAAEKAHLFEHLRTIAHPKTAHEYFQSLFRVRNALSWQIS